MVQDPLSPPDSISKSIKSLQTQCGQGFFIDQISIHSFQLCSKMCLNRYDWYKRFQTILKG